MALASTGEEPKAGAVEEAGDEIVESRRVAVAIRVRQVSFNEDLDALVWCYEKFWDLLIPLLLLDY
jgi:hypothetical protein